AGALWSSLIVGFLILILLLVFITQNTASTPFTFLGWHWSLPLGVAILLAAVVGGLITVAAGTARIIQLRRVAKKHHTATRPA
ncbi:LapA family protein, partial [Mycobacterium malmoense]|uniref:LapA family protein n=1 Tax=Mycobacterium malmoense TaxID=1780 RepID=UPI000AB2A0A7